MPAEVPPKKFKIAVGYPPIQTAKGVPLLSQNRQFQYFNAKTYIYPMVPAYAASQAQAKGYDVVWLDGIAEEWTYEQWAERIAQEKPDMLMVETKSPVVKQHWKITLDLKERFPDLILVWVGDQVTFNPKETMMNSTVDYIITGGDYDFMLSDLADSITKGVQLVGGIWGGKGDNRVKLGDFIKFEDNELTNQSEAFWVSGPLKQTHNLDELPFVDRDLTRWQLYAYANGNYKDISNTSIVAVIGSLLYFISPLDVVPDFILGLGFLDDAFIIGYVFNKITKELDQYQKWKDNQKAIIHI